MSLASYTLPLSAGSSLWMYEPARDSAASEGWNASYTGSTVWPPGGGTDVGDGSLFFRTHNAGASVAIDFTGTGLLLCFRDNGATHTLNIDGHQVSAQTGENDASCRELGATTTLRTGDLDFVLHSVVLDVTASDTQEFQFFGGVVETKVAVDQDGDTATEVTIDDRDESWTMEREGSYKWDVFTDPLAINGTGSFTCPYGSGMTAIYKFKGASAIVFYGRPARDTHDFSIVLDQTVFSSDSSVSGWTLPSTVSFFQASLNADHEYTLTYRNFADAKPNCTHAVPDGRYCCSAIDAFKLLGSASKLAYLLPPGSSLSSSQSSTSSVSSPTSPSGSHITEKKSSKSNTGAIAGGVVGGLVVAAIIAAVAFFVLRRRRREQEYRTQFPHSPQMLFSGSQHPTSSVVHGTVGSDVAHATISPFTYSPPASSHTPSVISPVTLMSGGPVIGKRPAPPTHASSSSSGAASSQQVGQWSDLAAHAGDSTLPPAYTHG